jgi:hypothetical protein
MNYMFKYFLIISILFIFGCSSPSLYPIWYSENNEYHQKIIDNLIKESVKNISSIPLNDLKIHIYSCKSDFSNQNINNYFIDNINKKINIHKSPIYRCNTLLYISLKHGYAPIKNLKKKNIYKYDNTNLVPLFPEQKKNIYTKSGEIATFSLKMILLEYPSCTIIYNNEITIINMHLNESTTSKKEKSTLL